MDLRRVGLHPDFWHPLARSREIARGQARAASFAGEPIVLVRDEAGTLHALEDRCAHRQVPLHEGAVCGNILRCGYHGWGYDMTGRCVDVPYLSGTERVVNGVRSYPCREAYGLAFVFPGDAARAEAAPLPQAPAFSDPAYKTRVLDRLVRCHYSFMHENLMDMNHQFLHRSLMGGISASLLGQDSGPGWLEARYTFARTGGRRPWGEKLMIGERVEGGGDRDTMTIRTQYPYQTLTFRRAGRAEAALDLWLAYVPVDREQRVNRTLGLMMIRRPAVPGLIEALWPVIARFTDGIFEQDRRIVELEQLAHDAQGADLNREVFPVIRELRALLARSGVAPAPPGGAAPSTP
jgi:hypothetical protein